MKEKLEILMADTGLRVGEIAAKLGVKAPVISHILSGRNQPNFTLTAKIISTFSQYNPYWWLGSSEIKLAIDTSAPSVKDENQNTNSSDSSGSSTLEQNEESAISSLFSQANSSTSEVAAPCRPSSEIERVVIFYKDHSFESFTPRK
jgi:DNA-binding XRE family transcriptional regulator